MIPWQPRPEECRDVVWRDDRNPLIDRGYFADVLGIFNSAVVPYQDHFAGVFRVELKRRFPKLHVGFSNDGLKWDIDIEPIAFLSDVMQRPTEEYAYDPRVCRIGEDYYLTWCAGHLGPTIGIARTTDFRTFERLENSLLPFNRNGVLFPRRISGYYWMLSRPSDNGHTPFGDIYISRSPDLIHWGGHRLVMKSGGMEHGIWWQVKKIGAGPNPIETEDGWLLLYHGVMDTCNGFEYSMGAAILNTEEPWKVVYRKSSLLLSPERNYETSGHVDNVVFPCAALCDRTSDRLAIYYGAADTSTCLAYCNLSTLLESIKSDSIVF